MGAGWVAALVEVVMVVAARVLVAVAGEAGEVGDAAGVVCDDCPHARDRTSNRGDDPLSD